MKQLIAVYWYALPQELAGQNRETCDSLPVVALKPEVGGHRRVSKLHTNANIMPEQGKKRRGFP